METQMMLYSVVKHIKGFRADSDNPILYIYNRLITLLISETE